MDRASRTRAKPSPEDGEALSDGKLFAAILLVGPFGLGITVAALAFLAAGIFWPQGAWSLLRILVATVALGYVASRLYQAGLPERTTLDAYSPFDGHVRDGPRRAMPTAIWNLSSQLEAADVGSAATSPIPWPVGLSLIREAERRLSERHGLRLAEPNHHAGIRRLVSEPTWLLIDPGVGDRDRTPPAYMEYRSVPMSQLDAILDDLESL